MDRNLAAQPVTRRHDTNTQQRGPEVIASSKTQRGLRAQHQHTQKLFMCVRDALCRWAWQRSSSSQVEAPSAGFPLPWVLFIGEISPVYIPSLIPLNSDWLDLHFRALVWCQFNVWGGYVKEQCFVSLTVQGANQQSRHLQTQDLTAALELLPSLRGVSSSRDSLLIPQRLEAHLKGVFANMFFFSRFSERYCLIFCLGLLRLSKTSLKPNIVIVQYK